MYNVEIVEAYQEPITTKTYSSTRKDDVLDKYLKNDMNSQSFSTPKKCPNTSSGSRDNDKTSDKFETVTVKLTNISVNNNYLKLYNHHRMGIYNYVFKLTKKTISTLRQIKSTI